MQNKVFVSAIVAMASNRVIGKDNQLPWHLPADLKHFKQLTTGHAILMGRKTHESIGRALPNRLNLILSRDTTYQSPGCLTISSLDEAIVKTAEHQLDQLFIIGGATVYEQLLPAVSQLYLTIIHHPFEGDALFPVINEAEWKTTSIMDHSPDNQHAYGYSFLTLLRVMPH